MDNNEDRVEKIFDIFTRKSLEQTTPTTFPSNVEGNNNIIISGDVTIYKNDRTIIKKSITPGPEHITSAQANAIQQLIYKLADIEIASGFANGDEDKARMKWWVILRNHYNVPSYREIPRHLGDDAIAWLKRQKAMNLHKIRRTDNHIWRNEHYRAIFAKKKELGISTGELFALVDQRLNKKIVSLKQLSDQNLKRLYKIVLAL